MPYGGGPKSGWDERVRPMKSMYALDCGSTGAFEISRFHQWSSGNSRRPPKSSDNWTPVEEPPGPGPGDSDGLVGAPPQAMDTSAITIPARELRIRFVILCCRAIGRGGRTDGIKSHSSARQV